MLSQFPWITSQSFTLDLKTLLERNKILSTFFRADRFILNCGGHYLITAAKYWGQIKSTSQEKQGTGRKHKRAGTVCCLIYITGGPLGHTQKIERENRDAGLIKAAHSPDFFSFLLTPAPLNVTGGRVLSTLQISTRIHLSPAHSCLASREARCSAPRTPLSPAARLGRPSGVESQLHSRRIRPRLHWHISAHSSRTPGIFFCLKIIQNFNQNQELGLAISITAGTGVKLTPKMPHTTLRVHASLEDVHSHSNW